VLSYADLAKQTLKKAARALFFLQAFLWRATFSFFAYEKQNKMLHLVVVEVV